MRNAELRLRKLENSGRGERFTQALRLIVEEHDDQDLIIAAKRRSGEIKPDTPVIVRKIVSPLPRFAVKDEQSLG